MWSFVGRKGEPRWLWQALDHQTGNVLAYVFGKREDKAFLELKTLLEPGGIKQYYPDGLGTYNRPLEAEQHGIGKRHTQKLERKHLEAVLQKKYTHLQALSQGYLQHGNTNHVFGSRC
jgi:insertion element IS1 protein InsB